MREVRQGAEAGGGRVLKTIEDLSELQAIDLEIFRIDAQLEQAPAKLADLKTHIDRIYGIIDREKKQVADDEKWLRDLEQEISMQTDLLAKSKSKLANARNEREVNAAQREIDLIKSAVQVREKESIQIMEAIDALRKSIAVKEEQFRELEDGFRTKAAETERQVDGLRTEREVHTKRRAAIEVRVPREALSLYDRIRRRKPQAMVEVTGGNCQGCHLQIPPQLYNEALRAERLLQCPNCTRIIYYRPPPAGEESET